MGLNTLAFCESVYSISPFSRFIFFVKLSLVPNVRRYVALPQSRGGACFCTRGAMQGYDVVLFIIALAKTVTPAGGPRREPGRAVPLTTKHSSLARRFSRYGEAMTYTDLLCAVFFLVDFILNK
jgi:hypothetical protein